MSYGRDRDQSVRGVGAVAARDLGNPRTRAQRVARARALRKQDRALSRFTFGPSGGMGAVKAGEDIPDPEIEPRPRAPILPIPTNTGIVPPHLVTAPAPSSSSVLVAPAPKKPSLLVVGALVLGAILLTRKSS